MPEEVTAPLIKGDVAGRATYSLNGKDIGFVTIHYGETVEMATFSKYFLDVLWQYLTV